MAEGGVDERVTQRILRLTDVADEPADFLMPISGYEKMPLVPLEEAVKPLVKLLPAVESYAYAAKRKCKQPDGNLTQDERAAIMLYSMGWEPLNECLYCALNATLRSTDRTRLKPWFLYLRLFLGAVFRLPCEPRLTVYRGVKLNLASQFQKGETIIWWGFTSCTTSIQALQSEEFLGKTGARTMFTIDCFSARDIQKYSYYPSEDEVLLLPASEFTVKGILDQGNGLRTIQMQEVQSTVPLLFPIPLTGKENGSSSNQLKNLKLNDDAIENKLQPSSEQQQEAVPMTSSSKLGYANRRFLFLGPTGVGKSTVVNILYNGDVQKKYLESPAETSSTVNGVTQTLNTYHDSNGNAYTDTIGFGDNNFRVDDLVEVTKKLIDGVFGGYNRIYLCFKYGRMSIEIQNYLDLIISIFGEGGLQWCTIIFTHCTDKAMNMEKYREKNVSNEKILRVIKQVCHVIFCNLGTDDDESEDSRLRVLRACFLHQLINDADNSSKYPYFPKPSNPQDWLSKIYEVMERFTKIIVPLEKIVEHARSLNEKKFNHENHYGTCTCCSGRMSSKNSIRMTCGHALHGPCLGDSFRKEHTCPQCKQKCDIQQAQSQLPSSVSIRRRDP